MRARRKLASSCEWVVVGFRRKIPRQRKQVVRRAVDRERDMTARSGRVWGEDVTQCAAEKQQLRKGK